MRLNGGSDAETSEVFDLLSHLVEKSLVEAERGRGSAERYRLLETMRQYGEERLLQDGEAVTGLLTSSATRSVTHSEWPSV